MTATPAPRSFLGRLGGLTRLEDLLLAGWIIFVAPLLQSSPSDAGSGGDVIRGLLGLVGLAGLAACIGARSASGVRTGLVSGTEIAWTIGPLFGAVALALDSSIQDLGAADLSGILLLALIVAAVLARIALPPLDARTRRALVTPFVLASGGSFGSFLNGITDFFDVRSLSETFSAPDVNVSFALFAIGLGVAGVLVFYLMLVYAPRQVAEREGTPASWAVRFGLFLVSLVIGATWIGIVRG